MRIEEIEIKENEREALRNMISPKSIAEVAALLDIAYNSAYGKLAVWEAKGWVRKIKVKKGTRYHLNQNIIEIAPEAYDKN